MWLQWGHQSSPAFYRKARLPEEASTQLTIVISQKKERLCLLAVGGVQTGCQGRSLLERSLPVVSVLRGGCETSDQGWSCVFAGVLVSEKNARLRVLQRQQTSLRTLATGSECSNRLRRSLPVRTLDLGWSSDSKTSQVQSLPVASKWPHSGDL